MGKKGKTSSKQSARQKRMAIFNQNFFKEHPELKGRNAIENQQAIRNYFESKASDNKHKLKQRLEFLTDGIVAIIITIMVLEIPLPLEEAVTYQMFLNAIGIFFLSFFLVAAFWYEHFKLFGETEGISQKLAAINFLFLAVLALIPILTKWMMFDVSRLSVLNYGIAYLIINVVKTLMFVVARYEHMKDKEWDGPHLPYILWQFFVLVVINGILLYVAWNQPRVALVLYIFLPLSSFFMQVLRSKGPFSHLLR